MPVEIPTFNALRWKTLRADAIVWRAIELARDLDLPDWMIVSGAIYNSVWNNLTGRPSGYGIKDIDLFYHDASDLSWDAEDVVIQRGAAYFAGLPLPVEIRNQARVHLWYAQRFEGSVPAFRSSAHSLAHFASETHAVGVHLGERGLTVTAPFGLDHIFALRMVPNRNHNNRITHAEKALRAKANWPEITIVD